MRRFMGVVIVALAAATPAWAVNSVVVESKTVGAGATAATIHVKLTNDVGVMGLALPLEFREITPGAFVNTMRLAWRDRMRALPGFGTDFVFNRIYPSRTGTCGPGGYSSRTNLGTDTLPHAITVSPVGILMAWAGLSPANLTAGSDATGSMLLEVGVNPVAGSFEIDTTCVDPVNHLLFAATNPSMDILPEFTKGIITVVNNQSPVAVCRNVTVSSGPACDAMAAIDNGSYDPEGQLVSIIQEPPGPYPMGSTVVSLIVTDNYGFKDTCQGTVTVVFGSAHRPVARCRDVVVGYALNGQSFASIDDGSYDPDGDPITLTQIPSGPYPLGQTLVQLVVSDGTCGKDTCQATITVAPGICNGAPVDVNCDGVYDVFDLVTVIDAVFRSNSEALKPCCVK